MDNELIKEKLAEASHNDEITCAECFAVAEELGIPVDGFAQILTKMDIKIIKCQLGCF
ncbi:MAG: hypothetical protein KAS16_02970 [Thermoplasmata archaeon]|nr:hypothetical protein [Thermoplasmata archaeon]